MKRDLTSKLAAAGIELSKANEEKLARALDTVLAAFQEEMRANIAPQIEDAQQRLTETAQQLSNDAGTSSRSFERDLESYRQNARQMNSEIERLNERVRKLNVALDQDAEKRTAHQSRRMLIGWSMVAGIVLGATLTVLAASWKAHRATERAVEAQRAAETHTASLRAFQSRYGLVLGQTEGGRPMFILPEGLRMTKVFGQGTPLNRINGWIVEN